MSDPQQKHGVNWMELMKLVAPVVGEVAGHGDRGAFLQGFMEQQQRGEVLKKQQAEADQKLAASGAEYVRQITEHAQGVTDPVDFQNYLAQADQAGAAAHYNKPGDLTKLPFNATKQHQAMLKNLTDQLDQLTKGGYNPDELAAGGASLHLPDSGQAIPIRTAMEITHYRPTDASGQAIPAPKKQDVNASTDYGRFLAKFAKDKGKTVDTLTTADELAAKDQFAQAGRAPVDPYVQQLDTTFKELRNQIATTNANKPPDSPLGGLTEEGVDYAATQYRVTGVMPALGMQSKGARTAVVNRAAQQAKVLGQSPAMAIQKTAAFKADAAALTQMRRMSSSAEAFEAKALQQADLVDSLSAKVNRTQYPFINDGLLAGAARIAGDTNTQLLFNALTTFTTEYAKIMEGSTGTAGASVSGREAAAKLVSAGLNKGTLTQTIEQMRKEMRFTIDGYGVAVDHITTRMGGAAPAPTPDPTAPPLTIGRFGVVVQ